MAVKKGMEALEAIHSPIVKRWTSDRQLPTMLDHLLSFVKHYQVQHNGSTPTVHVIANELGTTDQQVRFYINMLEQQGRLHRFGQNPIRIMLKDSPVPLDVSRRLTAALKGGGNLDGTKKERYEAVDAKRQQLGRFIGETWKREDRAPTLREMMEFARTDSALWVTAQVEILRDRGMIDPFKTALTPAGEQTYGLTEENNVTTMQKGAASRRNLDKAHDARRAKYNSVTAERDAKAMEFIHGHYERTGKLPNGPKIAEAVGMAPSYANSQPILKRLTDAGKIVRNKRGHLRGIVGADARPAAEVAVAQGTKPAVAKPAHNKRPNGKPSVLTMRHLAMLLYKEEREFGRIISTTEELTKAMGFKSETSINRVIQDMGEMGWLVRPKFASISKGKLTEAGRKIAAHELGFDYEPKDGGEDKVNDAAEEAAVEVAAPEDLEITAMRQEIAELRRRETMRRDALDGFWHEEGNDRRPMGNSAAADLDWRATDRETDAALSREAMRDVASRQPPQRVFFNPRQTAPVNVAPINPSLLGEIETSDLVLELIERGYVVRRA